MNVCYTATASTAFAKAPKAVQIPSDQLLAGALFERESRAEQVRAMLLGYSPGTAASLTPSCGPAPGSGSANRMVALCDNELGNMSTANIRISAEGREILRELARKEGQPMAAVLEKAIERYRRQKFLEEANARYAALRANPREWKEEAAERELWDRTSADGLEDR